MTEPTPADLVRRYVELDDYMTAETKRFNTHLAPVKTEQDAIRARLHEMLLGLGSKEKQSLSTDYGTAYTSTIMTPKVVDRDKFLDFVNDKWDEVGNEMLQLSAPQKDAVRTWIETHDGHPPPGVEVSSFVRVNIRRS